MHCMVEWVLPARGILFGTLVALRCSTCGRASSGHLTDSLEPIAQRGVLVMSSQYLQAASSSQTGCAAMTDFLVPVQLEAELIPVLPDGGPDTGKRIPAAVLEVGSRGLTLVADRRALAAAALVVGVKTTKGRTEYVGIELADSDRHGADRFWGNYGGSGQELLQPRNLMPRFHFESMTFAFGLPLAQLRSWAEVGVLQPIVLDELRLCPRCSGLPTYRHVCRHCGSPHVASAGCGPGGESYRCRDCQRVDSRRLTVPHCPRCQVTLAEQETVPLALRGYHAQRLDVLAFAST